MPTVVSRPAPATAAPLRYDRAFYSGMALLMAATVFAGFARTYHALVARLRRCGA